MKITDIIKAHEGKGTAFSFEVLPPLKGTGIDGLKTTVEKLMDFAPQYINITTHRSEYVYKDLGGEMMQRLRLRRRPGTVAVAAVLQREYGIPIVPHILCSGFTAEETEYVLLDLQFLGIENLLVLRGDKAKDETSFKPTEGGYAHTTELEQQINRFNQGFFNDGSPIKCPGTPFNYGVACYPEKHEEAPNMDSDFKWFKKKVELGAEYAVSQLFFDNSKFLSFVARARSEGLQIPIIPGIKPLTRKAQLTLLPRVFHCDIPEELARAVEACKTDEEVKQVGIEWGVKQCRELIKEGLPSIHFYTTSAVDSVAEIARQVY